MAPHAVTSTAMTSRRVASAPAMSASTAKIQTYTTGTIDQSRSTHEVSLVISDAIQQNAQAAPATRRTRSSGSMRSQYWLRVVGPHDTVV